MKVNSVRKRKKSKFQELVTSHSQKVKDRKVESPTLTGRTETDAAEGSPASGMTTGENTGTRTGFVTSVLL